MTSIFSRYMFTHFNQASMTNKGRWGKGGAWPHAKEARLGPNLDSREMGTVRVSTLTLTRLWKRLKPSWPHLKPVHIWSLVLRTTTETWPLLMIKVGRIQSLILTSLSVLSSYLLIGKIAWGTRVVEFNLRRVTILRSPNQHPSRSMTNVINIGTGCPI